MRFPRIDWLCAVDRVVWIFLRLGMVTLLVSPEFRHMCVRFIVVVLILTDTGTVPADEAGGRSPRPDVATRTSKDFRWNVQVPERRWEFVVIHHSATTRGSVESIHRDHQSRRDGNGNPWLGIGYHFVIGNGNGMPDGTISPTFRWKQQLHGAHSGTLRHNGRGVGICLIGNFEESAPTEAQRKSVTSLIRMLTDRYEIAQKNVKGHRQIRATACPGRHFPFKEIVKDSFRVGVRHHPSRSFATRSFQ